MKTSIAVVCMFLLAGCDQNQQSAQEKPAPQSTAEAVPPPARVEPEPAQPATRAEPIPAEAPQRGDEVDLIGDKPEAAKTTPQKRALLEDFAPAGPQNHRASQTYALMGGMKADVEQLSKDLDNGGKEVTRLLRTTDELAKKITDLAKLWPEHGPLCDLCGTAKRSALILNEELGNTPRQWTHVRWMFDTLIEDLTKMRQTARFAADSEPMPTMMLDMKRQAGARQGRQADLRRSPRCHGRSGDCPARCQTERSRGRAREIEGAAGSAR